MFSPSRNLQNYNNNITLYSDMPITVFFVKYWSNKRFTLPTVLLFIQYKAKSWGFCRGSRVNVKGKCRGFIFVTGTFKSPFTALSFCSFHYFSIASRAGCLYNMYLRSLLLFPYHSTVSSLKYHFSYFWTAIALRAWFVPQRISQYIFDRCYLPNFVLHYL